MAIALGGPDGLVQAVKDGGGLVGMLVRWHGAWTFRDYGSIDRDVARAEALGVSLLVQAWPGGDKLNHDFLHKPEGVWDEAQKVQKTRAMAIQFFRELGTRTAKATRPAHIVIEPEFNKGWTLTRDPEMAAYLLSAIQALRETNPKARLFIAPGDWHNARDVAQGALKAVFDKVDGGGARTMRSYPRQPVGSIPSAVDALLAAAQNLRSVMPGKPVIVSDFAIGTYGGPDIEPTIHPYGRKGAPKEPPVTSAYYANEQAQAATFTRLLEKKADFERAGVTTFIYRGLKDAPNFDAINNHYGYAERAFGVVRADGSRKPGYPILMRLAEPAKPEVRTEAEYQEMVRQRDAAASEAAASRREAEAMRAKLQAVRAALDAP